MALVGECVETEPSSFEEAVQQPVWVDAMVEEYDSIVHNSVWDVVLRLKDKSIVSSRWLYKVEQATDGSVEKHKARFVSRGFSHVEGIEYDDTFSPIARYSSIRSMLALSAQMGWTIHEMDVKTVFLNGDDQLIKSCKEDLAREFKMKDVGLMHYFLGMEVWQKDGEVFVSQGKYANEILRRFHMEKCKPMQTPLAVNTRPYFCFAMNQLSQAMVQPTKLFWKAAKHVLRYLRGTSQYGLWYRRTEGVKLQGFTNADWVGSPSDWKITSGGIFNLGLDAVSWYSRKQRSVTFSSAKSEFMASIQAACEAIWMRKILVGLFGQRMDPTVIYCDN
eukprot:PITA_24994